MLRANSWTFVSFSAVLHRISRQFGIWGKAISSHLPFLSLKLRFLFFEFFSAFFWLVQLGWFHLISDYPCWHFPGRIDNTTPRMGSRGTDRGCHALTFFCCHFLFSIFSKHGDWCHWYGAAGTFFLVLQNFANSWRACSRLYQNENLQEHMRLTEFFKLYKIVILLHRCDLKILAKTRFEKSAISLKIQQIFFKCRKICKMVNVLYFQNFSLIIW